MVAVAMAVAVAVAVVVAVIAAVAVAVKAAVIVVAAERSRPAQCRGCRYHRTSSARLSIVTTVSG